jgi:ARC6-like, IMS domain
VVDRSGIIQKLEDKVAAALRDHNLTAAAGGTPAAQSAMAEYNRLVQDASSSIGIRYLALHSVAVKQGFYVDKRDQQEMLGTVAQEMGNLSPGEVLAGIQKLKSNYPAIYQCDAVALDRMESNAVEFMTRLPMDQQDRAVAEAKNTQLNARPIDLAPIEIPVVAPQPFIPPPQQVESIPIPVTEAYTPQSTQTYTPQPAQTYIPQQTQLPAQNNSNKSAVIIGGGMIAAAILFSTILLSQQPKPSVDTSNANAPATETRPADGRTTGVVSDAGKSVNRISQDEAVGVVKEWLAAKNTLFGPPYNQQLGDSLTVGKARADNVRGPSSDGEAESSLEWLRNHGKSWKYGSQRIDAVKNFVSDEQQAVVTVSVYEQRALYNNGGGIERSIDKTTSTTYTLRRSDGRLKIADFK